MEFMLIGSAAALVAATFFASPAQDDPRPAALKAVFADLEKGHREKAEDAFKARWHAEGYEKNLCGGSGLSGKDVYAQGARKKWFLKPDLARARFLEDGAVAVVSCDIWAWEKEKAVDRVDLVLIQDKESYRVLGGGEKRADVDGLVSRWIKKEPLEAPKKD